MNINKLAKVSLVAVLVVTATFSVMKFSKADNPDCSNPQSVLDAHILSTGEFGGGALAVVTNNSDCSFNVGIDDYLTSNNSRYDSQGTVIGPRQTVELHINVPDCQYRLELTTNLTVLDSAVVRSNVCGVSNPAPAPTPTPAPAPQPGNFTVSFIESGKPAGTCVTLPGGVSNRFLTYDITAHNNSNQPYEIKYLAFHSNTAGCLPYDATIGNGLTKVAGIDSFAAGQSGTLKLQYDTQAYNCGRTQYDAGYFVAGQPSASTVFIGVVVNYGVDCSSPVPVPPAPTPAPAPVPTPAPVPIPMPVVPPTIINTTNGPCAINATNSCNTITNTSTITQTGTGNNAQVNQSGANGGYTGNQQNYNLVLPWMVSAVIAPTPTPNPATYLSISKMVRNITSNTSEVKSVNANVNDTVEFVIRVSSPNNQSATNVRVTDSLPYGLTYVTGSTTIDNSYSNDGITSGGISLGSFYSGRLATIRFRATVGQGYNYGYNSTTTLTNSASVYADNASTVTDSASVIVGSYVSPQNNQTLTIQKTARNITRGDTAQQTSLTARAGDGIEFTITVMAPYNTNLNNVVVSDLLPAGMNYTVNSTTLNNVVTTDGIVSGGLNIGSLSAGQKAEIKFYATINQGVAVNQQLVNTASARADNVSLVTSQPVYITISNNNVIAGGLNVKTGPTEDAFALASIGGLMSSALYAARRKALGSLIRLA